MSEPLNKISISSFKVVGTYHTNNDLTHALIIFPTEYFNYGLQAAIVHISLLEYKELRKPKLSTDCTMKRDAWDYFLPSLHVILNLRRFLLA